MVLPDTFWVLCACFGYMSRVFFKADGFDPKNGLVSTSIDGCFFEQRDLEKFMPLEHPKYVAPEYCSIPKGKGPCFFLTESCVESCVVQRRGCFQVMFFSFFSGVYHGVSPYVLSMFLLCKISTWMEISPPEFASGLSEFRKRRSARLTKHVSSNAMKWLKRDPKRTGAPGVSRETPTKKKRFFVSL